MKTTKVSAIGILLLFVCTFCTNDPIDYKPMQPHPVASYKYLNVAAEVFETKSPIQLLDNYNIDLFGNVSSCNLSQSNAPCITIHGMIAQPDAMGNFKFEEGGLLLESTTTNCKLWGQFSGMGALIGDRFYIDSDVEVDCGTGVFRAKNGQLRLTITGLLSSEDQPAPTYDLVLKGRINN